MNLRPYLKLRVLRWPLIDDFLTPPLTRLRLDRQIFPEDPYFRDCRLYGLLKYRRTSLRTDKELGWGTFINNVLSGRSLLEDNGPWYDPGVVSYRKIIHFSRGTIRSVTVIDTLHVPLMIDDSYNDTDFDGKRGRNLVRLVTIRFCRFVKILINSVLSLWVLTL